MICPTIIQTERLVLIPATSEMLHCDLDDHDALSRLLNATIPPAWPPPLLDREALDQFIALLDEGSDPQFCSWYWIWNAPNGQDRTLIGSGGTGSLPGVPGAVMIGYSVLDEYQGNGYATEALRDTVPVIFADSTVQRILATTYPELKASIRVLEKIGFVPGGPVACGEGMEEGTVRFVLERK